MILVACQILSSPRSMNIQHSGGKKNAMSHRASWLTRGRVANEAHIVLVAAMGRIERRVLTVFWPTLLPSAYKIVHPDGACSATKHGVANRAAPCEAKVAAQLRGGRVVFAQAVPVVAAHLHKGQQSVTAYRQTAC